MFTIRNIVLTIAVFGSIPLSLAAPTGNMGEDSPAQYEQRSSPVSQYDARGKFATDINARADQDGDDVLDILMARGSCYTTSNYKTYESCNASECGASQCVVSDKGRCVWAEKKKDKRPSGCSKCKCAMSSD